MAARKRVFVLAFVSAALLTAAAAVPAMAQIYGGFAYTARLTGVVLNGAVIVPDQTVNSTGPLPAGGGTVTGTLGTVTLPSGLGSATVGQEQASGSAETSSATSQITTISILPTTLLPAPLTGTGILQGTALDVSTSVSCGAPNAISTSAGALTIAGVAVTLPTSPNQTVTVRAPITGNPVLATVTLNFQSSVPGAAKASSLVVDFPSTGFLAGIIHGQITISHAESALVCPPVVTAVSPNAGPTGGGNTVTISGSGFTGATGVSFGGTPATGFQVNGDGSITATAPAGTGTVDVTVTGPAGTSATGPADHYTYFPPPTVTSVTPNSGSTGGGTVVTIRGGNLSGATGVSFGGTPAQSFVVNPDGSITAVAPPGVAGTVDVTVTTPGGTSAVDPADRFTFVLPGPPGTGRSGQAPGAADPMLPLLGLGAGLGGALLGAVRLRLV